MPVLYTVLLAAAAVTDGLLAGASLDQSIKQRAAGILCLQPGSRSRQRHRLVRSLGYLGGAVLTIAAAGLALALGASDAERWLLVVAALLAIAHSLTTARAAPINFSQRRASDDAALEHIFSRFERWQTTRAILQFATFIAVVLALVEVGS